MASHARQLSAMPNTYSPSPLSLSASPGHLGRESLSGSTAYSGSEGWIDHSTVPSVDRDRDVFDVIQLAAPSRAVTPARPALGSRLLSTLSNAQPAAKALTRSGFVLHSRAKSLATFVPRLNTSATTTPEKEKAQQPNTIFGDLFSGESAPIRLGIPPSSPTKEREETDFVMEYKSTFTERPPRPDGGPRRRSAAQNVAGSPPAAAAAATAAAATAAAATAAPKAGWFSRKPTLSTPARPQDDILDININSALFPHGPADPLSPHAFNDLLLNATNLLQRMQTAYKEKIDYIASVQPEIDAQKEEVEEAQTRSEHLKLQLEDMGRKAQNQEQAMMEMADELTAARLKAQEVSDAPRMVKLVRRSTDGTDGAEDEETPRRRKRGSAGSASDSGFESDAEYADSVFSGGTDTPASPPIVTLTATHDWPLRCDKDLPSLPGESTMSGSSGASGGGKRLGSEGAVWATVERLCGENKDLRRQMDEMHRTLQGCIDFVTSVDI